MDLIKDDRTTQFDELTSLADETLELYRDLADHLDDSQLSGILARHIDEQSGLLDELRRRRRAHRDLPQAGDPELAHLHSLLAQIRALVLPGETRKHVVESLLDATTHLRAGIERVLALQLPADEAELLAAYKRTCESLEEVLRKRLQ